MEINIKVDGRNFRQVVLESFKSDRCMTFSSLIEEYMRTMRPAMGGKIRILSGELPGPTRDDLLNIDVNAVLVGDEIIQYRTGEKEDPLAYFNPPEPPKSTALPAISGLLTTADW